MVVEDQKTMRVASMKGVRLHRYSAMDGVAALDRFMSTVERSGTGTGRNGTVTGQMTCRFPSNGSRSFLLLLTGDIRQNYRFRPSNSHSISVKILLVVNED